MYYEAIVQSLAHISAKQASLNYGSWEQHAKAVALSQSN